MLQDQSRNRTPMPGAQAPAAAPPDTGPARAEAGIVGVLSAEAPVAPSVDLPAPGSPEAMEAFSAACRSVDQARFLDEAEGEALKIGGGLQYWTSEVVQQAQVGNFTRIMPQDVEAAKATSPARLRELRVLTLRRELRMAEAVQASRLHELHALAYPDDQEEVADTAPTGDAVDLAIEAHRAARAALTAACNPADAVWVEQNGGDTSDEAMAPAREARDAASDAETDAWDALLETRPSDPDGLLRMLRYIGGAGPMEVLGDAREFGRNIAEAAEAALRPAIDADAELIALGRQFDALHALWREADKAEEEPVARHDAILAAAKARGGPTAADLRAAMAAPGLDAARRRTDNAYGAMEPTIRKIMAAPVHTVQGLAVKARTVIPAVFSLCDYEQGARLGEGEDWTPQVVRSMVEAVCAAAGVDWRGQPQGIVTAASSIVGADLDPIFAALGEAQRLDAVRNAISDEWKLDTQEPPELEARRDAAIDAFWEHWNETVLKTVPTTSAGCAALSRFVVEYLDREQVDLDEGPEGVNHDVLRLIMRSPMLGVGQAAADIPDTAASADDTPLTMEGAAALDFQAYSFAEAVRTPSEWLNEFRNHATAMHLGDRLLRMNKMEMVGFICGAVEKEEETVELMYRLLTSSSETLDGWANLLNLVADRYLELLPTVPSRPGFSEVG